MQYQQLQEFYGLTAGDIQAFQQKCVRNMVTDFVKLLIEFVQFNGRDFLQGAELVEHLQPFESVHGPNQLRYIRRAGGTVDYGTARHAQSTGHIRGWVHEHISRGQGTKYGHTKSTSKNYDREETVFYVT
jgi:hypothetical protein